MLHYNVCYCFEYLYEAGSRSLLIWAYFFPRNTSGWSASVCILQFVVVHRTVLKDGTLTFHSYITYALPSQSLCKQRITVVAVANGVFFHIPCWMAAWLHSRSFEQGHHAEKTFQFSPWMQSILWMDEVAIIMSLLHLDQSENTFINWKKYKTFFEWHPCWVRDHTGTTVHQQGSVGHGMCVITFVQAEPM